MPKLSVTSSSNMFPMGEKFDTTIEVFCETIAMRILDNYKENALKEQRKGSLRSSSESKVNGMDIESGH